MFQDNKAPGEAFSPVFSDPSRKLLWDAAQYIRKHGHCKRMLVDSHGRVCINGALMMTAAGASMADTFAFESRIVQDAIKMLVEYLDIPSDFTFGGETAQVMWNNTPGRTANEVINALEGAAIS